VVITALTCLALAGACWAGVFVTYRIASLIILQESKQVGNSVGSLGTGLLEIRNAINEKHDVDALYFKIIHLKPMIDYTFAHRLATLVYRESKAQAVDPNFVIALIRTESNFKPNAVSPTGAVGLTQIMPMWKTALQIPGALTDPEISIRYGIQIFKTYERMYNGNTATALAAYNQGPVVVNRTIQQGDNPANNNDYTANIQKFYVKLKALDRGREGLGDL
jgi:soluble lytic murein transglycosylase-like protein